jgi:hypothetical protein
VVLVDADGMFVAVAGDLAFLDGNAQATAHAAQHDLRSSGERTRFRTAFEGHEQVVGSACAAVLCCRAELVCSARGHPGGVCWIGARWDGDRGDAGMGRVQRRPRYKRAR